MSMKLISFRTLSHYGRIELSARLAVARILFAWGGTHQTSTSSPVESSLKLRVDSLLLTDARWSQLLKEIPTIDLSCYSCGTTRFTSVQVPRIRSGAPLTELNVRYWNRRRSGYED